jgi:hypothetical protein
VSSVFQEEPALCLEYPIALKGGNALELWSYQ